MDTLVRAHHFAFLYFFFFFFWLLQSTAYSQGERLALRSDNGPFVRSRAGKMRVCPLGRMRRLIHLPLWKGCGVWEHPCPAPAAGKAGAELPWLCLFSLLSG